MNASNSYISLTDKLEAFVKKYYKNQLLKGAMLCFSAVLSLLIALSLAEYLGEFESAGRTVLFYLFIGFVGFVCVKWLFIPLFKLKNLSARLSHQDAAKLIGYHFPEINDKIVNTLQLHQTTSDSGSDLVLASIEQKTSEMRNFSFVSVISYAENKKYLRFLVPPLLVIVGVLFINAEIITESSKRILQHNTHFESVAPFNFVIKNTSLTSLSDEDFTVELTTKGRVIPKELFIVFENETYRLKSRHGVFHHTFKSLQKDVAFYFTDKEFNSKEFRLIVNPKPIFTNLELDLSFPSYTKKKPLTIKNSGSAIVPEGTKITWKTSAKNASSVLVRFIDSIYEFKNQSKITLSRTLLNSENYALQVKNQFSTSDSSLYSLTVIKDEHPKITLQEEEDSLFKSIRYFTGEISDDYGFSKLSFVFKNKTQNTKFSVVSLPISAKFNEDTYYHLLCLLNHLIPLE